MRPVHETMPHRSPQLVRSIREKVLISFTRPFERGSFIGYVLEVGPNFFLLAVIDNDTLQFNGFSCIRLADVRNLEVPHKYAAFIGAVLRKVGERAPRKPSVTLTDIGELLRFAARKFPLVTIHRERIDPDVCQIGRVLDVNRRHVTMLEIGPGARWDAKTQSYRLSEITRVDFGGRYEHALHLIGGEPSRN